MKIDIRQFEIRVTSSYHGQALNIPWIHTGCNRNTYIGILRWAEYLDIRILMKNIHIPMKYIKTLVDTQRTALCIDECFLGFPSIWLIAVILFFIYWNALKIVLEHKPILCCTFSNLVSEIIVAPQKVFVYEILTRAATKTHISFSDQPMFNQFVSKYRLLHFPHTSRRP